MGFNLSDSIQNLNDAMFPGPNKATNSMISSFGGQSNGFAKGMTDKTSDLFYVERAKASAGTVAMGIANQEIPRSIANKYALYNFQGFHGNLATPQGDHFIDKANNPLMGGDVGAKTVSISKIINYFEDKYPKISYRPADFLYGKYYKKIPVNHLITLRRFATPIADNIYNYNIRPKGGAKADSVDASHVAGVTAVTYLGDTAGNKLSELLKFSFGLNWKKLEAEMEAVDTGGAGG